LPLNIHIIEEDLVKEKTKVITPIGKRRICENWCENVSYWIDNIKSKINSA
jgi:hypothetical protein